MSANTPNFGFVSNDTAVAIKEAILELAGNQETLVDHEERITQNEADIDALEDALEKRVIKKITVSEDVTSIDDLTEAGYYHLPVSGDHSSFTNEPWPSGTRRLIITYRYSDSSILQAAYNATNGAQAVRYYSNSTWTDWVKLPPPERIVKRVTTAENMSAEDKASDGVDLLTETGFHILPTSGTYKNEPWTNSYRRVIVTYNYSSAFILQVAYNATNGAQAVRYCSNGTWTDWIKIPPPAQTVKRLTTAENMSSEDRASDGIDLLTETGFYTLPASGTYKNEPWSNSYRRVIVTYNYSSAFILQVAHNATNGAQAVRYCVSGTWTDWASDYLNPEYVIKRVVIDGDAVIDDLKEAGYYCVPSANSNTGLPSRWASSGRRLAIVVYRYGSAAVFQQCINFTTGQTATRMFVGASSAVARWSQWVYSFSDTDDKRNDLLYSLFLPIRSNRYIYGKGKWWDSSNDIDLDWNTVEAYEAAAQQPDCWGISGDVQWCATANTYVMYHDSTVTYNGETRYINDLTLAELQSITLTNGGSIPTFEDFVNVCRKYGKVCFVETKRGPVESVANNNQWVVAGHTDDFKNLLDYICKKGMANSSLFLVAGDDVTYMLSNYPNIGIARFSDGLPSDAVKQQIFDNPQLVAMPHYPAANDDYTVEDLTEVIEEMHNNGRLCITWASRGSGNTPTPTATIQSITGVDCDAVVIYGKPTT